MIEIVPSPEELPLGLEIVDREFIFWVNIDRHEDEGGIILQDKGLAEAFLMYIERHLSANCPEHLKGAHNVAQWFEERFGVAGKQAEP